LTAGLSLWVLLLAVRLVTGSVIGGGSVYLLAGVTVLVVAGLVVIASFPWYAVPGSESLRHWAARRRVAASRMLVWGGAVLLEIGILMTLPIPGGPSFEGVIVAAFLATGGLLVLAGLEILRRLGIQARGVTEAG
jgi:hypothetical protein